MPAIVKKCFEEKRGYANYYFNRLEQQRVWKAWSSRANLEACRGAWTIAGAVQGGGKFSFRLSDAEDVLKVGSSELRWAPGESLGAALQPMGSGGLFPALYLWRRLALEGTKHFGQIEYLGTAPLPGHDRLADVLVGTHKGVECWFYFDPAAGNLLAVELYPSENVDPCEVCFSEFHEVDGRVLPARMEVGNGDNPFGIFKLDKWTFEKSEKK
jgi:hypothetical protein